MGEEGRGEKGWTEEGKAEGERRIPSSGTYASATEGRIPAIDRNESTVLCAQRQKWHELGRK